MEKIQYQENELEDRRQLDLTESKKALSCANKAAFVNDGGTDNEVDKDILMETCCSLASLPTTEVQCSNTRIHVDQNLNIYKNCADSPLLRQDFSTVATGYVTDLSKISVETDCSDVSCAGQENNSPSLKSQIGQKFTALPIDLPFTLINETVTSTCKPKTLQTPPPHYKHLTHLFLADAPPTYSTATGINVELNKEPDLSNVADSDDQHQRCGILGSICCERELTTFEIFLRVFAGFVFIIIIISVLKNAF